jgi:hydroxymethylpyrimidine pyrophosphatase-like HAD family hydrolase
VTKIRLLSTDFDGTLIAMGSRGRCSPDFAAALEEHSGNGGLWAINTGRTLDHVIDGLEIFDAPVDPDFLLTTEREIYRRDASAGWVPHGEWNSVSRHRHAELFKGALEMFAVVEQLAQEADYITVLYEDQLPAGLVTNSEDEMEIVAGQIQDAAKRWPDFSFQRNSIYLRFCHRDYHKGSALGELCRLEAIEIQDVLAAGDHFNDLAMLDGRYAKNTACPANAIEPVKELVRRTQGYVAEKCWADGVAEALTFYGTGRMKRDTSLEFRGEIRAYAPGLSR